MRGPSGWENVLVKAYLMKGDELSGNKDLSSKNGDQTMRYMPLKWAKCLWVRLVWGYRDVSIDLQTQTASLFPPSSSDPNEVHSCSIYFC